MAETSATSPTLAVNDTGIGEVAWSNPTYVYADDSNRATAYSATYKLTNYIKATHFDFAIPAEATITGIKAEAKLYRSVVGGGIWFRAVKGGTISSTKRLLSSDTTEQYQSTGGSTDLWGETWTPSDINSDTFGIALYGEVNGQTLYVNHIRLTVYYTTVVGPANVKTYKGLASASVKTCKGLAIASVKTKKGLN